MSRATAIGFVLALTTSTWTGQAQEGGEFSIRQSSVVTAFGRVAGGDLSATVAAGMPAAGRLIGGEFEMTAGIVLDPPAPAENLIFSNGFEGA
ncbi:MAG: hypothetical protein QNJ40_02520 [Xanthomonadales bacterium]|nr:hypothetical protein [Xanthomonadales bacterium]